ncbi:hypothetical protein K7X08_021713 [Anisodus acutangulus]|uniref:Uncharacterized protein n=1 Tax=Anisodus acutangulus TaxID=402998 RepID=A0A9Q1M854_9SOLA|nr:hypothetical protein K7X08_021713 [Anisodus acutangulus]
MSSTQVEVIDNRRENAEVYTDPLICMQKSLELLKEINMPRGLLPLEDIVEVGRNHETGFVWLKQKKETDHCFKKIKKTVTYAAEVTSFVEDRRLKNITGVKTKELSFWVNISDISIEDPQSNKITFAIPSGIKRVARQERAQAPPLILEILEVQEGRGVIGAVWVSLSCPWRDAMTGSYILFFLAQGI